MARPAVSTYHPEIFYGSAYERCSDIQSTNDYYPFGSALPGRGFDEGSYKFGFNGKENDDEVYGDGNFQDYGMRMYDTRVGRFVSVDPITAQYPMLTPYQFASNTPIMGIDLDGMELLPINSAWYRMKYLGTFSMIGVFTSEATANVPKEVVITRLPGTGGKDIQDNVKQEYNPQNASGQTVTDNQSVAPFLMITKRGDKFYAERETNNANSTKLSKSMSLIEGVAEVGGIVISNIDFVNVTLPTIEMKTTQEKQRNRFYSATKIVDAYMGVYCKSNLIDKQFKKPEARADFVNYLLDGSLPKNGSTEYRDGIVNYGKMIMKAAGIPIRDQNASKQ